MFNCPQTEGNFGQFMSKFKEMSLYVPQTAGRANRWVWSELIRTVTNCTPAWCMRPQSSGDSVSVSLDAEVCPAIINGPAWCSRQFGSIRNWNALGLIRQTEPKYPLLVMRTLCHSLTPLPFWPCRKRAQGKHLHFFLPAETVSFDEVERMKGRIREQSIASYSGNGDCPKQWHIKKKKRDLGTSDENMFHLWMQPIFLDMLLSFTDTVMHE